MNDYISQPAAVEEVHFREELYPRGFRKIVGMMIVIFATSIPPVSNWQYGDDGAAGRAPFPAGPPSKWGQAQQSQPRTFTWSTFFSAFFATVGLMIYYPRWGFKRYALLAGPIIAIGTGWVLSHYLAGRVQVYRAELALAAMFGALPGVALYTLLAYRKARKQGMVW